MAAKKKARSRSPRTGHPTAKEVVGGTLAALDQFVQDQTSPKVRRAMLEHAAVMTRAAAEKYRLDLIAEGATQESLDAVIKEEVDRVRGTYFALTMSTTQAPAEA